MFPMNGKPFGPGGYGSPDLLRESRDRRYFVRAMREMVTPTGMTKWESMFESSNMRRGGQKRK